MEYKYKAFISYRHVPRDSAAAKALHTTIENFIIPRKLRKDGVKRLGKVFRDEEELSASNDLAQHIRDALDVSEYLIVICSSDTLESNWVPQEISYFLEHHPKEKLLTVLTGGNTAQICEKLLPGLPQPLALSLSDCSDRVLARELRERFPKLGAPLLGCEYDDLVMRDQKRRRRRLRFWIGGITLVAAAIIAILLWSNRQIEVKNAELERQNNEILLRESELLTQDAQQALSSGDRMSAMRDAISALSGPEGGRPYYAPAEQMLFSAMDLFGLEDAVCVPEDIVLEQASPVEELLVSADGSLVTTMDPYSVLRCFDSRTGAQVWTRQIRSDSLYGDMQLKTCGSRDILVFFWGYTITGIDQRTGEILWSTEFLGFEDRFVLSDDGTMLAQMVDNGFDGELNLAIISTEDGKALDHYQIARSDKNLELSYGGSYDFSADGRLFAGCYSEVQEDRSEVMVCFVTDLSTGQTQTVYRQPIDMIYKSVFALSFTDQDTTLTIVRDSEVGNALALVEKISISDRELLWQCRTTEHDELKNFYLSEPGNVRCLFGEGYILVGMERDMYVLDAQTGEITDSAELPADLVHMEQVHNGDIAITLSDGTYYAGYWNTSIPVLVIYRRDADSVMRLEPSQKMTFWNDGWQYIEWVNDVPYDIRVGTREDGFGFTVSVPPEDDHRVIIRSAVRYEPELDRDSIFVTGAGERLSGEIPEICSGDTVAVLCRNEWGADIALYHYVLFDRAGLTVTDEFSIENVYTIAELQVLPDGSGCIFNEDYLRIVYRDGATGAETILADMREAVPFRLGDTEVSSMSQLNARIRLADGFDVLDVLATEHGLKLWRNGQALEDVPYPGNQISRIYWNGLIPGSNGYVYLKFLLPEDTVDDTYHLYSTADGQWYSIPCAGDDAESNVVSLGARSPVFAVLNNYGVLRIYDIPTGNLTAEIPTGLTANSIEGMTWLPEDRWLAVWTRDQNLMILDPVTGQTLFQDTSAWDDIRFAVDPQWKRLYIWDRLNGMCVDLESWTMLTRIPGMLLYDPVSDRIWTETSTFVAEPERTAGQITAVRLPTTEELVELGKVFLGE